jgi:hypothetical protein
MRTSTPVPDIAKHDQLFKLISAVAAGDAERGDVVAALREQGIDALDLLVAVLGRASRPERPLAHAHRWTSSR